MRITEDVWATSDETEFVTRQVIKRYPNAKRILELGTGSGAMAIAFAKYMGAEVTATDNSGAALDVARRNAHENGVNVNFLQRDMFNAVDGKYDLIVSNMAQTPVDEFNGCGPAESRIAGKDGLKFIRVIAGGAADYLCDGGSLVLQTCYDPVGIEKLVCMEERFRHGGIEQIKCDEGRVRAVAARLPS